MVLFSLLLIIACLFESCEKNNEANLNQLLDYQIDNTKVILSSEINSQLLFAEGKILDYPNLKNSFDSVKKLNSEIDNFIKQKNYNEDDTVSVFFFRQKIKNEAKLNIKFVDLKLISIENDSLFRKAIEVDFIRAKYLVNKNYILKKCNVVY